MKLTERDELLIRLDEKTESIIRELQDQNRYLNKLNGRVRKVEIVLAMLIASLAGTGILEGTGVTHLLGG